MLHICKWPWHYYFHVSAREKKKRSALRRYNFAIHSNWLLVEWHDREKNMVPQLLSQGTHFAPSTVIAFTCLSRCGINWVLALYTFFSPIGRSINVIPVGGVVQRNTFIRRIVCAICGVRCACCRGLLTYIRKWKLLTNKIIAFNVGATATCFCLPIRLLFRRRLRVQRLYDKKKSKHLNSVTFNTQFLISWRIRLSVVGNWRVIEHVPGINGLFMWIFLRNLSQPWFQRGRIEKIQSM